MRCLFIVATLLAAAQAASAQHSREGIAYDVKYADLPAHIQMTVQRFSRCVHGNVNRLRVEWNSKFCGAVVFNVQIQDKATLKTCYSPENLREIRKSIWHGAWEYDFEYSCLAIAWRDGMRCPKRPDPNDILHASCAYPTFNILLHDFAGKTAVTSFGKPIH